MGISRDAICANRIGFIAELGGMEEELVVYGCCYLEDGKVKYRVSSNKEELYRFLVYETDKPLYPTPIHSLTERCIIASGEEEAVRNQLKRKLARNLQQQYPAEFFERFQPFVAQAASEQAWPLLQELREQIEGHFDADELQLYEMLLKQSVQRKLLSTEKEACAYQWLGRNRSQMEADTVVKERFERTFYGFVYDDEEKSCCTEASMDLDKIVDRKIHLEQHGIYTSPILTKTFWFAENRELPGLKGRFKKWLQSLTDIFLQKWLQELPKLSAAVDRAAYQEMVQKKADLPEESQRVLQWYGKLWNV